MALINCKECGSEMSDQATSCPKCGWKNSTKDSKQTAAGCLIMLVIAVSLYVGCEKCSDSSANSNVPKTKMELIKDQFSSLNGRHKKLEEMIIASLNDPGSYEHASSRYFINIDSTIVVTTTFRAKNAFGGTITQNATATFTAKGDLIEVVNWFE